MGKGFAKQKKQARLLQEQFSRVQQDLQTLQVTGTAGNQLVTVTLNGDNELLSLKIHPDCVDPDDVEGLEDLIKVAYNDARQQLQQKTEQHMPNMGHMFGLPT